MFALTFFLELYFTLKTLLNFTLEGKEHKLWLWTLSVFIAEPTG